MKIQVFGSGCPTCKSLYELVKQTATELGIESEVEYISDITRLIEEGIATSPALKIGDKVVCAGRMPSEEEIKDFLNQGENDDDNVIADDKNSDDSNARGCSKCSGCSGCC